MSDYVRLTKKTAQEIVKRELGLSGSNLKKVEGTPGPCYRMTAGNLLIIVRSRLSWPYNRYELEIGFPGSVCKEVLFTDTLEQDFNTMSTDEHKEQEEIVKQWVRSFDNRSRLSRVVDAYYETK